MLSEEELVSVLIDLHMSEALKEDMVLREFCSNKQNAEIKSWIWEKHNITEKDFDTTIFWYTNYPKEMNRIFQQAVSHYSMLNDSMKSKHSLDTTIYELDHVISLHKGYNGNELKSSIPSLGVGRYVFTVKTKVNITDKSNTPRFVVYFDGDTVKNVAEDRKYFRKYIKDNRERSYSLSFTYRGDAGSPIHYNLYYSPEGNSLRKANMEILEFKVTYRP